MAYIFQTYSFNQVYTSAGANQTEVNIRDHSHGNNGVSSITDNALSSNVPLKNTLNIFSSSQRINGALGLNIAQPNAPGDFSISGSMKNGIIPLPRMRRTEAFINPGAPNNVSNSFSIVGSVIDLGTVTQNDIILFQCRLIGSKSTVSGETTIRFSKTSGTSAAIFMSTTSELDHVFYSRANVTVRVPMSGIMRVVTNGTLIVGVSAKSEGSDLINAQSEIHAIVLNGGFGL